MCITWWFQHSSSYKWVLNVTCSTYFSPAIVKSARTHSSATLIDISSTQLSGLWNYSGIIDVCYVWSFSSISMNSYQRKYQISNVKTLSMRKQYWMEYGVFQLMVFKLHDAEKAYTFLVWKLLFTDFYKKKEWFYWITKEFKNMLLLKESPTLLKMESYTKYKSECTQSLSQAKKKYFTDRLTQASNDIKSNWSLFNW